MDNVVLTLLAHPDDAEFLCAGTLVRLVKEHGWKAHIASLTPGDCGSVDLAPVEISRVRRSEAVESAYLIEAGYHCLDERDLLIFYNEATLAKVTGLLRQVRPRIVLTHSPADYILDHEMTSALARAAAFAAPAPNFLPHMGHGPALAHVPHVYYCDAIDGKDALGRVLPAAFTVDISDVMERKAAMLACHASQRDWLRKHHRMDQYVETMRTWGFQRGQTAGVAYAEGFRQHLGHGYPHEPLLQTLLGGVPGG